MATSRWPDVLPPNEMLEILSNAVTLFNEIISVAVLITAASLLLYTLTFNLRDRAARSFSLLLSCVVVIYLGDIAASILQDEPTIAFWLKVQMVGLVGVPATYLHLSDALLALTGQPSRGRRRLGVRVTYLICIVMAVLVVFSDYLVRDIEITTFIRYLRPGVLFWPFSVGCVLAILFGAFNIYRAYNRCLTRATRRRMGYLLTASLAIPFGVFPYLLVAGEQVAVAQPFVFLFITTLVNGFLGAMLIVLTYTVSFFGTPQPDRIVKSRLFRWTYRGPFVASLIVATYVTMRWAGRRFDINNTLLLPSLIVVAAMLPQFAFSISRNTFERWFFYGNASDREDLKRLRTLNERLLTSADIRQFLEIVLATACDVVHVSNGFVAVITPEGPRLEVSIGAKQSLPEAGDLPLETAASELHPVAVLGSTQALRWETYWLFPLRAQSDQDGLAEAGEVLGVLGVEAAADALEFTEDERDTLNTLIDQTASALEDMRLQQRVFDAMDTLLVQVDELQRLRAAAQYTGSQAIQKNTLLESPDAAKWVKDALTHYWGGPKLTENPLLRLQVVQTLADQNNDSTVNALRLLLKDAIEEIKPPGNRKFTADWLLYNILELKFMEGKKVREVALKLAVSEADLYRKQRVAVEEVARVIASMENRQVGD